MNLKTYKIFETDYYLNLNTNIVIDTEKYKKFEIDEKYFNRLKELLYNIKDETKIENIGEDIASILLNCVDLNTEKVLYPLVDLKAKNDFIDLTTKSELISVKGSKTAKTFKRLIGKAKLSIPAFISYLMFQQDFML